MEQVVFLGVGDAYKAALHILNSRAYERLACWKASVCFASNSPIYAVHEEFFSSLGKYYQKRSKIIVNGQHPVWDPDRKKASKKFGRLTRSGHESLGKMMWEHREEVEDFLRAQVNWDRYTQKSIKDEGVKSEKLENGDMEDTIMLASGA